MRMFQLDERYYFPEDDKQTKYGTDRKPVLTLRHLNKLRKIRDRKQNERLQRLEIISAIYGEQGE